MSIIAKNNDGSGFEKTPLGNQIAVCAFVEDIGTHAGEYMGVPNKRHQIVVCWELGKKMQEGDYAGKPFMISKFYTLSLGEKANLRKDLESWRGKAFTNEELDGFDVENVKGVSCLLNIIEHTKQSGDKVAKIASISPIMEGMEKLTVFNEAPPEWIGEMRKKSLEYTEGQNHNVEDDIAEPEQYTEDDLPF